MSKYLFYKSKTMGNKLAASVRVLSIGLKAKGMAQWQAFVPRTLREGDKITLMGEVAADAKIFSVNLVSDCDENETPKNIAYHHKIMYDENKTVLNSKIEGQWQEEEIVEDIAVDPGQQFEMVIHIENAGISFYCDGNYHSTYSHKIPFTNIVCIQFWSGLEKIISMKVDFA